MNLIEKDASKKFNKINAALVIIFLMVSIFSISLIFSVPNAWQTVKQVLTGAEPEISVLPIYEGENIAQGDDVNIDFNKPIRKVVLDTPVKRTSGSPQVSITNPSKAEFKSVTGYYIGPKPDKTQITTDVVAVESISMEKATIQLPKRGQVDFILKCADFNIDDFSCPAWEKTDIPFTDKGNYIEFEVTSFSGYAGASITIINVQSYPTVGGTWEVRFTTEGTADLMIEAVDGTTWSNTNENEDLKFLEVRCGDKVLDYDWDNNKVIVPNYNCGEEGREVSKVLTAGAHHLKFTFGGDIQYAQNYAVNLLWNKTYNSGDDDQAQSVAIDSLKNIIVVGSSFNSVDNDYYIIKYDQNGNQLWNRTYNGGYNDQVYGVAVDTNRNIVATGSTKLVTGDPPIDDYRMFTIKYDENGTALWNDTLEITGGDYGYDYARSVTVDANNNIIITGYNTSDLDMYMEYSFLTIKYNSSGSLLWYRSHAGQIANSVDTDKENNIFVTGSDSDGQPNALKYDENGTLLWNKTIGGSSGVAVDSGNNIYFNDDYILYKYDSFGDHLWNVSTGIHYLAYDALAFDASGKVIVTGSNPNYTTAAYSQSGSLLWSVVTDTALVEAASDVAADTSGGIVITGRQYNGTNYDFWTVKYQTSQALCGQTLTESFALTEDIDCTGYDTIVLGADEITLDGAGHKITTDGTAITATGRTGIEVQDLDIDGGDCQSGEYGFIVLNDASIRMTNTNLNGDGTCTAVYATGSDLTLNGGIFDNFLDGVVSADASSLNVTDTTVSNIFNAGIEANYIDTLSIISLTCNNVSTCIKGDEINTVTIDTATATEVGVFANIDPITTSIINVQINQTAQQISLPTMGIISGGTVNFDNIIIDGAGIDVSGGASVTGTDLDFFSSNNQGNGLMKIDSAPGVSLDGVTGTVSDGATGITIINSDNITLNNLVLTSTDAGVQGIQITDAKSVIATIITMEGMLGGMEIINTPTVTASNIIANNIFGTALSLVYGTTAMINGITVNTAGTGVSADEFDSVSIINSDFDNVDIAFDADYEDVTVNNTDVNTADIGIRAIAPDALSRLELNGVTMTNVSVGVDAFKGIVNADQLTISAITTGINLSSVANATITDSTIGNAQTGVYFGAGTEITLGPGMNICGNKVKDIINYGQLTVVPSVYADKVVGTAGPFLPCQNWWNIPGLDTSQSTDLSQVADRSSVNLTLASSTVSVNWLTNVNTINDNYYEYVAFGADFVSLDSANLDGSINTSATVSMSGINCETFKLYYASGFYTTSTALKSAGQIIATEANIGGDCNNDMVCTNVQCSGNVLSFTAQHFSGFAAANGTSLTIWDDTDTQTKYVNQQINFFANYSNTTSGAPITGANCNITFQIAPTGPSTMIYNASSTFYEYNRTFSTPSTSNWNVSCSASGFAALSATDTVSINVLMTAVPEFSTYAMILALVIVISGFFIYRKREK